MDRLPVILSAIVLHISTLEYADTTCFKKELTVLEVDAVVATTASAKVRMHACSERTAPACVRSAAAGVQAAYHQSVAVIRANKLASGKASSR